MPTEHPPISSAERMVRLQLRTRDIVDDRVLDAMSRVPREVFVPAGSRAKAYEDSPLPIGHHQTISQPYMVGFMTQALALRGPERVLEVGTGSGYQTAVLAELCRQVFSMERIPELAASALRAISELGYCNVTIRVGDGSAGWPEQAPFDRILVGAAAPAVPPVLGDQLADNGILVVPVGDWRGTQVVMLVRRTGRALSVEQTIGCRFVPLIGTGGFPPTG